MSGIGQGLLDLWGGGRRKTYTAKGWHAQLSALVKADGRGSKAADAAGLDPAKETLLKWLSRDGGRDDFAPTKANRDRISAAYDRLAGGWDSANETRVYNITGLIDSGDRTEDRTLKVEGADGKWERIAAEYNAGTLTPDRAEELFIEDVIEEAIGETSDGWDFPGDSYSF